MVHVVVYGQSMAGVNGKARATWSCVTCGGLARAAREVREVVESQHPGSTVVGFHNSEKAGARCRFVLRDSVGCAGWLQALDAAVATGSVNQVDVGKVRIFVIGG